jgi:hypothetical protein
METGAISVKQKKESFSVQDYIDETPQWRDGTPVSEVPMTAVQWRLWSLASAGKFFGLFVNFCEDSDFSGAEGGGSLPPPDPC